MAALTAVPMWLVGPVLTSSLQVISTVITERTPRFARKASDEPLATSTTLQNDDALLLSVVANATYDFECQLIYDSPAAADLKVHWTGPAGFAISWVIYAAGGGTFLGYAQDASTTAIIDGFGVSVGTLMKGTVATAGTAGTLTLQWAQNASSGTTNVKAGSYLRLTQTA